MTEYAPQDVLIGPIIAALTEAINQQIPSIQTIYPTPTDALPDNNSVQFPYEVCLDDEQYPGLMRVDLDLYITHAFKRVQLSTVYAQMQPYIYPWLMFIGAWRNQILTPDPAGFTTELLELDNKIRIVPMMMGGQPYVCLVLKVKIITEFSVDTSLS